MKYPRHKVIIKDYDKYWILSKKNCDKIAICKKDYLSLKFPIDKFNHIYEQIPIKGDFGLDQRIAYEYYKSLETLVNN